jgi:hypothetical protein
VYRLLRLNIFHDSHVSFPPALPTCRLWQIQGRRFTCLPIFSFEYFSIGIIKVFIPVQMSKKAVFNQVKLSAMKCTPLADKLPLT